MLIFINTTVEYLNLCRDILMVYLWATGWMIGVSSLGMGFEFFITASRPRPTQPPVQRVPGALSLVIKQPEGEAEVNNEWNHTSTPPLRLHGMMLS